MKTASATSIGASHIPNLASHIVPACRIASHGFTGQMIFIE
jgi:hypothetical protein